MKCWTGSRWPSHSAGRLTAGKSWPRTVSFSFATPRNVAGVGPERYAELRHHYGQLVEADNQMVVLRRATEALLETADTEQRF